MSYCKLYTIGDGTRTQIAMRADGVWFRRAKWRGAWGAWDRCTRRPFPLSAYLVIGKRARLPDESTEP